MQSFGLLGFWDFENSKKKLNYSKIPKFQNSKNPKHLFIIAVFLLRGKFGILEFWDFGILQQNWKEKHLEVGMFNEMWTRPFLDLHFRWLPKNSQIIVAGEER